MNEIDALVWLDCETFGLNHQADPILEVGVVVTDLDGEVIEGPFSVTVWEQVHASRHTAMSYSVELLGVEVDKWVYNTHTKNGLFETARLEGFTFDQAAEYVIESIPKEYRGQPMVGNSIGFDREALRTWMPSVDATFHYRSIDVSSLKELCRRMNPELYAKLGQYATKTEKHRVEPDLMESINEGKFYFDNFLFQDR